jgi:hypothetical protein
MNPMAGFGDDDDDDESPRPAPEPEPSAFSRVGSNSPVRYSNSNSAADPGSARSAAGRDRRLSIDADSGQPIENGSSHTSPTSGDAAELMSNGGMSSDSAASHNGGSTVDSDHSTDLGALGAVSGLKERGKIDADLLEIPEEVRAVWSVLARFGAVQSRRF